MGCLFGRRRRWSGIRHALLCHRPGPVGSRHHELRYGDQRWSEVFQRRSACPGRAGKPIACRMDRRNADQSAALHSRGVGRLPAMRPTPSIANGDIVGQTLVGGDTSAFYLPHGGSGTVLPVLDAATPIASAAGRSELRFGGGYSVNGGRPNAFIWFRRHGNGRPRRRRRGKLRHWNQRGWEHHRSAASTVASVKRVTPCGPVRVRWTRSVIVPYSLYHESVAFAVNGSGDIAGVRSMMPGATGRTRCNI